MFAKVLNNSKICVNSELVFMFHIKLIFHDLSEIINVFIFAGNVISTTVRTTF